MARKIELEDDASLEEVEIEAAIEQYTSVSNFVVRGQRCDASASTFKNGTAADLKVGVRVELKGARAGDVVRVSSLEIKR